MEKLKILIFFLQNLGNIFFEFFLDFSKIQSGIGLNQGFEWILRGFYKSVFRGLKMVHEVVKVRVS